METPEIVQQKEKQDLVNKLKEIGLMDLLRSLEDRLKTVDNRLIRLEQKFDAHMKNG